MITRDEIRDALLLARFELGESLRTRRAIALAVLFLLLALGMAWAYSGAVNLIREQVGDRAILRGAAATAYDALLLGLAGGDRTVARFLATQPPVALFFVKGATSFVPVLVALTCAELIAADIATRTLRFSLLRTSRLAYALGKVLGQALLVGVVLAVSAGLYVGVAAARIDGFEPVEALAGIARFSPFVIAHALAFVALAALASQLASSAAMARAVAVLLLMGLGLLLAVAPLCRWLGLPLAFGRIAALSPFAHTGLAFQPEIAWRLAGPVVYLGFAAAFFALGYARLRSRDV